MKNIIYLLGLLFLFSCGGNDENPEPSTKSDKTPSEYLGKWRVDYYMSGSSWNNEQSGAFYIDFIEPNKTKFRDVNYMYADFNNEFVGTSKFDDHGNGNSVSWIITRSNGAQAYITVSNSQAHPGYKTFIINYNGAPSYYQNGVYEAKKQ